ncbi:metalloregulator ArsR/SmtB family transcription factor [Streptomyces sp. 15-116A]|uniref:metalloregulator ArsR/SmtB family transcription factor n=1 Tax=Streptomyces sp. 15-116A TaxID=2259035 RepID=UPI0021B2835A|nr:metalloregulator ArsR/SmtB family transcription factor [Streptomyces sp. 15-116A]MCT7352424.1 metalloregulator ArsR/SmtB family transcription factor [Streptomyces sp. 15-116A]
MLGGMTSTSKDPQAAGLARLAGLIADETRAACLMALLDGRAWTAGELARHAGVAASTVSEHLGKLVAGGLLAEERQGRHRYVRLADAGVAQLVEDLAARVPPAVGRPRGLRAVSAGAAMARGRTCYDHLAGRLGIAVTDAMTRRGLLRQDTGFALTDAGVEWFEGAGIPLERGGRRPLARGCLDWTERRPHLAGVAGAALCRHALEAGWCVRVGSGRAVKVTALGEGALRELLGVEVAALGG